MASFFLVSRLDAGYKLDVKIEGGLKVSDGPGGISEGPVGILLRRRCKKEKCIKPKHLNWCKQNCACCQDIKWIPTMGGPKAKLIPDPVETVRDAARCLEWRKRRNAKKCQYGSAPMGYYGPMTKRQIPEPNSDQTDANDTKETKVEESNGEEGLDYDNEDHNESG